MTVVPIADRLADAAPMSAADSPPITVSATPYRWRDPRSIPRREFLYGFELQRKHVSAVIAPGAAGKTTFKVARALAMVTGKPLLGRAIHGGPKRVWLWNLEDDLEELQRSIQACCLCHGISQEDVGDRLFVDSGMDGATLKLGLKTPLGETFVNEALMDALVEELKARNVDYLDIDPFVSAHGVDENDNMAIDAVVKALGRVANRAGVAICLTHHVAKARSSEVDSNSARGAVALTAACRSVLVLNRMSEEEATNWKVPLDERRRHFRVFDDKNNRAPVGETDWYRIESVSLGNGGTEFGDNVGAVVPWSPPDIWEGVTPAHIARVQQDVAARAAEAGGVRADIRAQRWVGLLICDALGLDRGNAGDKQRAKKLFASWLANGAFITTEGKDERGNERTFVAVGKPVEPESIRPKPNDD